MQNNKKRIKINAYGLVLIFITMVFLIFMLSGITLSFNNKNNSKTKQVDAIVFNSGDLAINFIDGNKVDLEYPNEKKYEYKFSVTNTGSNRVYYSIYLKNTTIIKDNIKYRLLDENKKEISKEKIVNGENLLQSIITIEPGITDRYFLVIDNNSNRTDIKGVITIENESLNKNTLQDLILSDNQFTINTKTKIGTLATENEGLIKDYDDYGITYYFRGNVDNNYLIINSKKFRIIRINGDGTIRAILDENDTTEVAFNNNIDENANNLVILEKSTIINELNNWVNTNIGEYTDLLVASSFCSDTDFNTIRDDRKYSQTYERIINNSITFKCFSTSYLSKVGLISPEEIIFAGGNSTEENTNYYLYNSEITYNTWTSGSNSIRNDNVVELYSLTNNGTLINSEIGVPLHIRPVINISTSAIAKGEGTKENPYLIVK